MGDKTITNDSLNLDATLENIIKEGSQTSIPALTQGQMIITKSGEPDTGRMAAIFASAFPDMEFQPYEEDGRKGIRSIPKPVPTTLSPVPSGYSPILADTGIKDLQTALESAQTDEAKYSIAVKLNTLVQTQRAYKFNDYKQRAESEFGVNDLTQAVEAVRQAELRSPFNPGNGLPSQQRMDLIEQLGKARAMAATRIGEYMAADPTLAAADALSKGTIADIEGRIKLEGRQQIIDEKKRQANARSAAVATMDPNYINGISILTRGRPTANAEDALSIGEQIFDKKLNPSPEDIALANATPDMLMSVFVGTKSTDKIRPKIINLLTYHEQQATNNEDDTKRNIGIFVKLADRDISPDDPNVSPIVRDKLRRINSDVLAQTGLSQSEKSQLVREKTIALKRELLADTIRQSMYADVAKWNGLVRSDPLAGEILKKSTLKDPINFRNFLDQYISANDGKSIQDKNAALQGMVISAMGAIPKSVVLPMPSEESFQLEAQRIVAQRMLQNFYTRPIGQDTDFYNALYKQSGGGLFFPNNSDLNRLPRK